jgi:hypothetical protein
MIMNRISSRVNRKWLSVAMAGIVVLGVLTACSASRDNMAPPGGVMSSAPAAGMKDGVTAPAPEFGPPPPPNESRDVVKTASMTITVSNTSEAADKAAVLAEDADGRVDSRSEDAGSGGGRATTSVVLRVPVAKLDGVVRDLKSLGTVKTAETSSEDVTAQRVDLDARIKALQTSVDRLLAIMRDAKDSDALIKAEDALSERQAELDSLRAQRDQLGDRIDYSTVNVSFIADQIGGPAPQEYKGFTGQIERGWDALVSVLSNLVLLFGLMLPWLGALAVACGLLYGIIRVARARRPVAAGPHNDDDPRTGRGSSVGSDEQSGGAADAPLQQ